MKMLDKKMTYYCKMQDMKMQDNVIDGQREMTYLCKCVELSEHLTQYELVST